jgi:putative ABC transport system permease protein
MKRLEGVRMSARAITGHRLRSALTIVGIVIGIATVIAFASFGASVQSDVIGEFQDTSASEIYVISGGGFFSGSGPPGSGTGLTSPVITTFDLEQIDAIDGTRAVIPRGSVPISSLTYRNETVTPGTLTATKAAAFEEAIVEGEAFESGKREIVINQDAASQFEANVSVGSTVEISRESSTTFRVVGITSGPRGGVSDFAPPGPEFYVPVDPNYRTVQNSPTLGIDQRAYSTVTVVADAKQITEIKEAIEQYINTESDAIRLAGDNSEVAVQSTEDVIGGIQSVLQDITRLITGIGVLALVVGAFGIANIMLVSVTERTKEIGIMKSVGATNREIIGLFLAESVLLGSAGAVIGIPVGLGVGYGGALYADVGFTLPYGWVLIAISMGITIGIIAGLYPAWRAARVDPIEALRYE